MLKSAKMHGLPLLSFTIHLASGTTGVAVVVAAVVVAAVVVAAVVVWAVVVWAAVVGTVVVLAAVVLAAVVVGGVVGIVVADMGVGSPLAKGKKI